MFSSAELISMFHFSLDLSFELGISVIASGAKLSFASVSVFCLLIWNKKPGGSNFSPDSLTGKGLNVLYLVCDIF